MLTGNLVRTRLNKFKIMPLYLHRESQEWLEVAESLLEIFRAGEGMTRGEIDAAAADLFGSGQATLSHRGLARVLEDRSEFEVVADVDPEDLRDRLFRAAALYRTAIARKRAKSDPSEAINGFNRQGILDAIAKELNLNPDQVESSLFADLKEENRILKFDDISAQRLIDRYNVALAQSVLIRAVRLNVEIRQESPARLRRIFQMLKFHRLLFTAYGVLNDGLNLTIEGPLSLFQSTTKYGVQMANWLPHLLHCRDFRLDADLHWGTKKELRTFHLERADGLVSHVSDSAGYEPPEFEAFVNRFRQIAPSWSIDVPEMVFRGTGQGGTTVVWMPDYVLTQLSSGREVHLEILGFWRRASLQNYLDVVPKIPRAQPLWAVSDKMKVDDDKASKIVSERVLTYRDIPSATDVLAAAERLARMSS
jgi:predicted nuclease of restriction endonuclease-like RecB superfamily